MNLTKPNSKKQKQKLILPSSYTIELAEETGIHIGDGSMNLYPRYNHFHYTYCGHATDDLEFSNYVKKLMKKLYNLEPSHERIQKDNTIALRYTRKDLINFKQKLGLPLGPKANIQIPLWIIQNNDFRIACIRGIFATDGHLQFQKKHKNIHYYPQLKICSKSGNLIRQLNFILNQLNIKSTIFCENYRNPHRPNDIWVAYVYGRDNLDKFVRIIGFCNPKHRIKYKKWKSGGGEI